MIQWLKFRKTAFHMKNPLRREDPSNTAAPNLIELNKPLEAHIKILIADTIVHDFVDDEFFSKRHFDHQPGLAFIFTRQYPWDMWGAWENPFEIIGITVSRSNSATTSSSAGRSDYNLAYLQQIVLLLGYKNARQVRDANFTMPSIMLGHILSFREMVAPPRLLVGIQSLS